MNQKIDLKRLLEEYENGTKQLGPQNFEKQNKTINLILDEYHESDIADAFEQLEKEERSKLYKIIDPKLLSEIFTHLEDPSFYLEELDDIHALQVLNEMDADDVVDTLIDYNNFERDELINRLDQELQIDIKLITSYDDSEIGSYITTNFNVVNKSTNIKDAMKQIIDSAATNDNINIIYCINDDSTYYGAFHLKDLIVARSNDELESIIYTNYPTLRDTDLIADVLPLIKDYTLEYLPVLDKNRCLIGIITHEDIVEAVDDEMSEDFSKLAGLTGDIRSNETLTRSIKKRIPWLIVLLFLNLIISTLVAGFEELIAIIPILAAFQSLLLDMAGNSGTQSLAVTLLTINNETLDFKKAFKHILRELRVGLINALICGVVATIVVTVFVTIMFDGITINGHNANQFVFSLVIGSTLTIGMIVSTLVGTITPMLFKMAKIDPATASGPFITTINDLVSLFLYFSIIIFVFGKLYHFF